MPITPSHYGQIPVYDLLVAAGQGRIGVDHRLLHAILDRPDESIPDLVRFGTEDREDDLVHLDDDLLAIFRHLKTPAAAPFYIEYIRRAPLEVPDEMLAALNPIRTAMVEPLLKLYGELEEEDSGEVAFLLGALGVRDERILRALLERLEYDAGDAAITLGVYGDPAARPALESLLAELPPAESHLRRDLEDALGQLGRDLEEDYFPDFDIWTEFPENALPEFDVLGDGVRLELLDSESPEFRAGAAHSFINRDLSDNARTKLYERARSDEDPAVRGECWQALAHEEDKSITDEMRARLEDPNTAVVERAGALIGLAREIGKPPLRQYAEKLYEIPEVRAKALQAMWTSFDRSFRDVFPKHLEDADAEVRREAIRGVGYLGLYDHAERLRPALEDDEFRATALFAYALAARHEISPGRIRQVLRRVEDAAGGLDPDEMELVRLALDERLLMHGYKPVFFSEEDEEEDEPAVGVKAGRNDPCPCGSGKKYKKCCGA
jgi:HEAT repeat protein